MERGARTQLDLSLHRVTSPLPHEFSRVHAAQDAHQALIAQHLAQLRVFRETRETIVGYLSMNLNMQNKHEQITFLRASFSCLSPPSLFFSGWPL